MTLGHEQLDIFIYSFALFPEQHEPSGSCSFAKMYC